MLMPGRTKAEEARRRAQDEFAKVKKREAKVLSDREKARNARLEKTARLRDLRLEKEAADREAAERLAADKAERDAARKEKGQSGRRKSAGTPAPDPAAD